MITLRELVRSGLRGVDELQTCFRLGADAYNRALLATSTVRFHLRNKRRQAVHVGPAREYRVRSGATGRDLRLRTHGGDLFVLHEVFTDHVYRLPETLLQEIRSATPCPTIVDLGANVGLTTNYYADLLPSARFVCVEPDAENHQMLRHNVAWMGTRASVVEGAIGERDGEAIFDADGPSWGRRLSTETGTGRRVQTCTLPAIMARFALSSIDLLKVDIEGGEAELFREPGSWLSRVRAIVIELHSPYSLERFEADVGPWGFRVFPPGTIGGNAMILAIRGKSAPETSDPSPAP